MSIIAIILGLALVGLIVYLIVTYIPMPEIFKTVIMVVVAIALILWVMQQFGYLGPTLNIR